MSWTILTATAVVTTAPNGTPAHSWQRVVTGKSSIAHKGIHCRKDHCNDRS
ncbi:MAG: hypothetical protein RIN62_24965 [Lacrimispora sp.]|nr:hypothetical protein [Lacrimispora sp.]